MNKPLKFMIFIVLSLVLLIVGCAGPAGEVPVGKVTGYALDYQRPRVGNPAPDFQFKMPDGTDSSLGALKGKVVLINFWRST